MKKVIVWIGMIGLFSSVPATAFGQSYASLCRKYQSTVSSGVAPIIADLQAGAWQVRSNAAHCLADRGTEKEIISALINAAGDQDARVRRSALQSLARLDAGADLFVNALSDDNELVRFVAAEYAPLAGAAAVLPLAARAGDPKEELIVRVRAARSLEALGAVAAPAVPRLVNALDAADDVLRPALVRALGAVGSAAKPAVPKLRAMLARSKPDSPLHGWLREAIYRIG